MFKLLSACLLAVFALTLGACSSNKRGTNNITEGDGPTIRYSPSEAGGPRSSTNY